MSNETATTISTLPADQALVLRTIFEWKYGGAQCGRIRLPHPDFPDEFKVRSPHKYTDVDGIDRVETCAVFMPATWTYLIEAELLIMMGHSGPEALRMLEAKKLITKQKAAHADTGQLWKLPDGRILDVSVAIESLKRTITVSLDGAVVLLHLDHPGDKVDRYELSPEAVALAERADPPNGAEVPWEDDAIDFCTAKDICDLPKFRGKLRQPNLSKKLRPNGPVRYMRRDTGSPKCKVHLADALNKSSYLLGSADQTDSAIDEVLSEDVERRKSEIRRTNHPDFDASA